MKFTSAMRPDFGRSANAGMSLITAIFLLLVMSALGLYIARLSTAQHSASVLDMQGSRAYHAARSGLEYGAHQVLVAQPAVCAPATSLALGGALTGFSVTVACASTLHTEGGTQKTLYRLTATACNQPGGGACPNPAPGANYVERQLQLSVINPP